MLWSRLRFLTVATLAVAIASGGAGVYVCGSQQPAPQEGQPVSGQPPEAKLSTEAGQPAADAPRARLRAQQLATRKAQAFVAIAKATRELAEIALAEYEDVNYPRDLDTVQGEIKLAESDLKRAEDRLDWARKMFDKGYVSQAGKVSEELALQKAVYSLEQAQSKKAVLVNYTRDKTIIELRSMVEKTRSDELAKQANWELERTREAKLARQLNLETN